MVQSLRRWASHRIRNGDRGQKGLRVRMLRRAKYLFRRSHFDNLAEIHDCHPVTEPFHRAQVVGCNQISHTQLVLQTREELEDLTALLAMIEAGDMEVPIAGTYPLAEATEALRLIEDREVIGKVIVEP